jgi:hypothetical protein
MKIDNHVCIVDHLISTDMWQHLNVKICLLANGRTGVVFHQTLKFSSWLNLFSILTFILGFVSYEIQFSTVDYYRISWPIRRTFFPEKCDLNSTCVLCAEGRYYLQTYKYMYIYYTSLSLDSEICFQIIRSDIAACERITFLSRDLP